MNHEISGLKGPVPLSPEHSIVATESVFISACLVSVDKEGSERLRFGGRMSITFYLSVYSFNSWL